MFGLLPASGFVRHPSEMIFFALRRFVRSNLPSGRGCCSMQVWEICNQPMSRQCDAIFARCWFIFIFCWLCIVETSFVFIYAPCLLYLAGARLELQADAMDFHFCKSGIAMRAPSVELVANMLVATFVFRTTI